MRAAVDVMGGDRAPAEILQGCWEAASLLSPEDRILLVGIERIVRDALAAAPLDPAKREQYHVVPAPDVIAMDESPAVAVRGKPNSSISVMSKLVAKGEADVAISAGNTGACVAAAMLRMGNLPGVIRPGIAVVMPTFHGGVVMCDAGANVTPKPSHLQQYALMAGAYAQAVTGVQNPRVGLLSIGEEDGKGPALIKESNKLLREEPLINFVGNVEGKDIFRGVVDVVVCDGFVGNSVLKVTEGVFEGLFKTLLAETQAATAEQGAAFSPILKRVYSRLDWQEYGGAPLLGVKGYCLICHGRSDARAMKSAIRAAKRLVESDINTKVVERIAQSVHVGEE